MSKRTKLNITGFLRIGVLFCLITVLPLMLLQQAFAATQYWCSECGDEFTIGDTNATGDIELIHPDNGCRYAGTTAFIYDGSGAVLGYDRDTWVTSVNPDTGEDTSELEDSDEEAFGADFIRMMLDTIISTGSEDTDSFNSVNTLLNFTFVMIIESIDVIVDTAWYWCLVWIGIMFLWFRYIYTMMQGKSFDLSNMTPEQIAKLAVRPLTGMVIIIMLPFIIRYLLGLSQIAILLATENPFLDLSSVAETVEGSETETVLTTADLLETAKETMIDGLGFEAGGITKLPQNVGALIQGVIALILPYIVSQVCSVGLLFVCFSREIELTRMIALAPIAMTDMGVADENGHGVQYLLEIGGIAFQGIAIAVTIFVADVACAAVISYMMGEFSELTTSVSGVAKIAVYMTAINLSKLVGVMTAANASKNAFR